MKQKLHVSYIGTKVADYQTGIANCAVDKKINVVFLGSDLYYEEKGYPFLLSALKKLDRKYASSINLTLTLLQADQNAKVKRTLHNFNSVNIINGYKPDDLRGILKGQHLSIVPVIWEDNLPQIAIESVANGVPVLSSNFGGASELCSSSLFKFKGGDASDFLSHLKHFVDKPKDLDLYWKYHNGLETMQSHCKSLLKHYGLDDVDDKITMSINDFSFLLQEFHFLRYYFENSFQNYNEIRKRAENWNSINNRLVHLFPYGSKRRKFIKHLYFRGVKNG